MADNSAPTESRLSIQASREGYSQDGDFGDHAGAAQISEPAQPLSFVALGLLATVAGVPHSYVVRLPGLVGFQSLVAALGAAMGLGRALPSRLFTQAISGSPERPGATSAACEGIV
jgi:hypothetical protein